MELCAVSVDALGCVLSVALPLWLEMSACCKGGTGTTTPKDNGCVWMGMWYRLGMQGCVAQKVQTGHDPQHTRARQLRTARSIQTHTQAVSSDAIPLSVLRAVSRATRSGVRRRPQHARGRKQRIEMPCALPRYRQERASCRQPSLMSGQQALRY